MAVCLFASTVKKKLSYGFGATHAFRYFYSTLTSAVSLVALLLLGGIPKISPFTLALGSAFGALVALQAIFVMKAYEIGPFSYTTVINTLSTVIPTLSGAIFWGESIKPLQAVGIVLFIVCIFLSVDRETKSGTTASGPTEKAEASLSPRWLCYTLITMLCTGLIGVFQKWHQSTEYKGELDGFLVMAFLASAIISVAALFIARSSRGELPTLHGELSVTVIILLILSGICIAANHKLNLYLSGVIESAVFFPIVNGGGLILSLIASLVYFKERLSVKKWLGIGVGIVALLLLILKF